MHPWVNFGPARVFARQIVTTGKTICDQALAGLKEAGVDITNPVQLLYVLKHLGPVQFEAMFGLGEWDVTAMRRRPLAPTDIFTQSLQAIDQYLPQFTAAKM